MLGDAASGASPGGYQRERFVLGRRNWRRRVLPLVRLVCLCIAAPGIVYEFWHPVPASFMAGFAVGGSGAIYLWARDAVPEHVQRHEAGAEGEEATASTLAPLVAEGWIVEHDVDTGHGNRDHVLVGPTGTYLLDSKSPGGVIEVSEGAVRVRR